MPVFGPIQIRKMFPDMLDLVSQLVLKLDRMGPENEIVPADDFTISTPHNTRKRRVYINLVIQIGL